MIYLTKPQAEEQIGQLLQLYPLLTIVQQAENQQVLRGTINIYRTSEGYTLNKDYGVELIIPIGSDSLPTVKDISNSISKAYPHRYGNGELCLETDTYIKTFFINGFDLVKWMKDFVEPYYFSYEYYTRYGEFPFGERPHAYGGIIDTYSQFFGGASIETTCKIMRYIVDTSKYRGHHTCPCGSGLRLRNCHGKYILPFYQDTRRIELLQTDIKHISNELEKYDQTRDNNSKAK